MQATQPGGNVFNTSANAFNTATNTMQSPAAFGARTAANMNPFQGQVTNRTMQDMERQRQMATNTLGAQAQAAGAFGGSRHGVAEALTNEAYGRQFGDMAANMNMRNFGNAQNLTMNQAGQLSGLAGQGFDMGNSITNQQMGQGTIQQGLNQALFDAAQGQFMGFSQAPSQSLQYPLAAISSVPHGQTSETKNNPGLFNYLSLGLGLL